MDENTKAEPPSVAIVGDPTGDLRAARAEATELRQTLAERARTTVLLGRDASRARVTHALENSRLFHYAGHASRQGNDGIESALFLADGDRLVPADLLTMPRVPQAVVLSACEASATGANRSSLTLGLAQSFLLAGADVALAPLRPISDSLAARFVDLFYKGLDPADPLTTAPLAFRAAVDNMQGAGDGVGSFRLMVR